MENKKYYCEKCLYSTNTKQHYNNHLSSKKHNEIANNVIEKTFNCENCKKIYKSYMGLWKHKKICNVSNEIINHQKEETSNILIDKVDKLENLIIELMKNQKPSTINNTNNSNNKNFNINLFLNEHCNNAIDIMEFAKNIAKNMLQYVDIDKIPEIGYVDTITNIITNSLKEYTVFERPLHRIEGDDTEFYVRHKNKWNPEYDDGSPILDKAIKNINDNVFYKIKETNTDKKVEDILLRGSIEDNRGDVKTGLLGNIYVEKEEISEYFELKNI